MKDVAYTDSIGQSVRVGDFIAYKQASYSSLIRAQIVSFSDSGTPRIKGRKRPVPSSFVKIFEQDGK